MVVLAASAVLATGGCAQQRPMSCAKAPQTALHHAEPQARTVLVLPGHSVAQDAGWWALGRNDWLLGREPQPAAGSVAELYVREHLRITNGRPREHTIFSTRSYQLRQGP